MIPYRIAVSGFLCYRDRQEAAFAGHSLWMLSGKNGTGKSSLFDAITFALFGKHRGGDRNLPLLINTSSDALEVEFDFLLEGTLYQARRTLRRGRSGTRQLRQWIPDDPAGAATASEGRWIEIDDTTTKKGFDDWVARHLGLSFETFTASVMLMQGRAENLLEAQPKQRHDFLAQIVGLDRYEALEERARDRMKAAKAAAEHVQHHLQALPAVTPADLEQTEAAAATAQHELARASAELDRLLALRGHAELWQRLSDRQHALQQESARWETLHTEAATLRQGYERIQLLAAHLPTFERWLESSTQRERHAAQAAAQQAEYDRLQARRVELATARREAEKTVADAEEMLAEARAAVAEATAHRDQERAIVPLLEQFAAARARTVATESQFDALTQRVQRLRADLVRQQSILPEKEELEASDARRRASRDHQVRSAEHCRTLEERLDKFRAVADQPECGYCGQPLTAAHRQTHFEALAQEQAVAEERLDEAEAAAVEAEASHADLVREYNQGQAAVQQTHLQLSAQTQELSHTEARLAEFRAACLQAWTALPESEQQRVAAWEAALAVGSAGLSQAATGTADRRPTPVPTKPATPGSGKGRSRREPPSSAARQLSLFADDAGDADPTHPSPDRPPEAEAAVVETAALREVPPNSPMRRSPRPGDLAALLADPGFVAAVLQSSYPTAGDLKKVRRRADDGASRLAELAEREQAASRTLADRQRERRRLAEEAEAVDEEWTTQSQRAATLAAQLAAAAAAAAEAQRQLPADWAAWTPEQAATQRASLRAEHATLHAQNIVQRWQEWERIERAAATFTQQREELSGQLAAIPEPARCHPDALARQVDAARQSQQQAELAVRAATARRDRLHQQAAERRHLDSESRRHDRERALWARLAEMLGRDGLQLRLLRDAESAIVRYANGILDRLSGGDISVSLRRDEPDATGEEQVLELVARTGTLAGVAQDVMFLSGSQRFRLAVALSLAVGQYANSHHRPVQAVIIDEGFGCLDAQNRQVMVQELQNLRTQLDRILLVSHQEEFVQAFPDGYVCELVDGATRLRLRGG